MTPAAFFDALWADFVSIAPAAASIRTHLLGLGEDVSNDHVAFRTFDRGPVRLGALERHLLALGYQRFAPYRFEAKRLNAFGYVHPEGAPRVFLSELECGAFTPELQTVVDSLVEQVAAEAMAAPGALYCGRPWAPVTRATYERLAEESEYAAWVAAHGFHANHFTISVNALSPRLRSVQAILDEVEALGFGINDAGGRVKGSPEVLLEQGSTLADTVTTEFEDGTMAVPAGYYEFALRHPAPNGALYEGFVPKSADRIFESTDRRRS